MAGPREIAIGIAKVLGSRSAPNPFPLTFRGESVVEAAEIVIAVMHECADANIRIGSVELDRDLFVEVSGQYRGETIVIENGELQCEARLIVEI